MMPSRSPLSSPHLAQPAATWILLIVLLATVAQGQVRAWDGGGADANWSTADNWSSNNVPNATAEAALFTNDAVGQTKLSPNLSADVTIGQLQYSATAPGYTITGTGASTLFLSPSAIFGGVAVVVASGAADQSITAAEVEFLSSQTWDIGGTTTLLVTGTIEDAPSPDYALTKNGTGTLVFSGDVRYDGATTLNAGAMVLSFNNTSMLSALTVNAGRLRASTHTNALGSSSTRNTITLAGGALELANDADLTFGHASRNTIVSANTTIRSDRLTPGAGNTHTLGRLQIGAQTLSISPGPLVSSGTAGIAFGATTLSGNATIDVASSASADARLTLGAIGQSGGTRSLTKTGSGTLVLTGASTYTGATSVSAGTLLVNGSIASSSTVESGAVLGGSGTVAGALVKAGGVLAPGISAGKLTINGNYQSQAAAMLKIELGGTVMGSQHDSVAISGQALLGGILDISLINSFVPSEGDAFQILAFASRSGDFSTITGGYLGSGLFLDTVFNASSLTLVATQAAAGDADLDGDIDLADLGVLASYYGQTSGLEWQQGDFDSDGDVDLSDLSSLAGNYGSGAAQAFADFQTVTAVPEPSSVCIFSMILLVRRCVTARSSTL